MKGQCKDWITIDIDIGDRKLKAEGSAAVIVTPLNNKVILNNCDGIDILVIAAQLPIASDDILKVLNDKYRMPNENARALIRDIREQIEINASTLKVTNIDKAGN